MRKKYARLFFVPACLIACRNSSICSLSSQLSTACLSGLRMKSPETGSCQRAERCFIHLQFWLHTKKIIRWKNFFLTKEIPLMFSYHFLESEAKKYKFNFFYLVLTWNEIKKIAELIWEWNTNTTRKKRVTKKFRAPLKSLHFSLSMSPNKALSSRRHFNTRRSESAK